MSDLQARATRGTFWAYVQNWSGRGLTLVVFFVLARLLSPDDFGAFAIATVLLTLSEVFVEQGLAHALVQRQQLEEGHKSSAFWATLLMGVVLALVALVGAGPLANYYGRADIAAVVRALSPVFVLAALSSVPAALLRRELNYRALAQRTTAANALSGVAAIVAAMLGAGVWSFVVQQLVFQSVSVFVIWQKESWRPARIFSSRHLREVAGFSTKMILVKLLDFLETRVVDLIVGSRLGLSALGNYALAMRAHQAMTQLVAAPLWESTISAYARMQHQREALFDNYCRSHIFASIFLVPLYLLIAATAEQVVPAVFGRQWTSAVLAFQVLSVLGALRSVAFLNGSLLQATGKPGSALSLAAVRVATTILGLAVLIKFGVAGVALSLLIGQAVCIPVAYFLVIKQLEVTPMSLLQRIGKPFLVMLFAALIGSVLAHQTAQTLRGHVPDLLSALICGALGLAVALALAVFAMPRRLYQSSATWPARIRPAVQRLLDTVIRAQESVRAWFYRMSLLVAGFGQRNEAIGNYAVIVPGDISSVGGSLGDQALIGGLCAQLKELGVDSAYVVCRPGVEMPHVGGLTLKPLAVWASHKKSFELARTIAGSRGVLVIGADVLDGFYSRFESIVRLYIADFAARLGKTSVVCGFSFNDRPDPATVDTFSRMSGDVDLLCRDEVSRQRLAEAAGIAPRLAADLGFMLKPIENAPVDAEIAAWLANSVPNSGSVVAWNLSPHSLKRLSEEQRRDAVAANARAITRLVEELGVRVVLVPHDFRGHASDAALLTKIANALQPSVRAHVLLLDGQYSAAEIKQACLRFDFLLTGRMHLMIAALGQGIPVAAVEYQGKFAGLFQHFGLGSTHVIAPADVCDADRLFGFVAARLAERLATQDQVRRNLPQVMALARTNLNKWPVVAS